MTENAKVLAVATDIIKEYNEEKRVSRIAFSERQGEG